MEYDAPPSSSSSPRSADRKPKRSSATPPAPSDDREAGRPDAGRRFDHRKALRWGLPLVIAVVLGIAAGMVFAAAIHVPEVAAVNDFRPSLITQLYDRHDEVFATFAVERRMLLEDDEIPQLLENAVLAIEDDNFYDHGGVDAVAAVRAQISNMRAGEIVSGASTLTMQLARGIFLTREQTWSRKIEEAFVAVELEKQFSKEQILTLYLNLINLGHGNWGMKSAARYYFNKEVDELTVAEAATLAGIIQIPTRYSPYRRPALVQRRRDRVLGRMLDEGFITRQEHDDAVATPLVVVQHGPSNRLAPYFAEEVRKHLAEAYGEETVSEGGLQVWTTLDPAIQRSAERSLHEALVSLDRRQGWRGPVEQLDLPAAALRDHVLPGWSGSEPELDRWYRGVVISTSQGEATVSIESRPYTLTAAGTEWTDRRPDRLLDPGDVAWFRLAAPEADGEAEGEAAAGGEPLLMLEQVPELQGAALVLESATGAVRGMVGGWDFERSEFNRATQALRQVGSAFKLFVFGTALEAGYTPADTLLDAPTDFVGADNELSYRPRNYGRKHYGLITLRRALEKSANVTAVKVQDMVGTDRVIDFARRCGVSSELPPYPSLALGVSEIIPLELAAAYAAIANQGTYVQPYLIERVESSDRRTLERHQATTRPTTDERIAYVLAHMLEGVIDRGTGSAARDLDIDLAGKTGTTDDFSDAWFVGFTPRYTLLTWVGYDLKKPIGRGMTGARAALPMWKSMVEHGLEEGWLQEGERFNVPAGVSLQTVEYTTGLLPGPGAERFVEEAFVQGTGPVQQYDGDWAVIMGLPWYQQATFYIPKQGERMPAGFGREGSDGALEVGDAQRETSDDEEAADRPAR